MKRTITSVILAFVFTAFAIHAVEQKAFIGAGVIESTTGGFEFPDGTVQLTAANLPCTAITYLPYVITQEGIYCLTGNLTTSMTSGNAIEIQADDVVLDLNGWKLGGRAAGTGTQTSGIYASQRKNITIRNGTIRGFYKGIEMYDAGPYTASRGHLIEHIRADGNRNHGLEVAGSNNVIRHNQVLNTGGTTTVADLPVSGIEVLGYAGRLIDNDIGNTTGRGAHWGMGIAILEAEGVVIKSNRVVSTDSETGTTGIGIYIEVSTDVLVVGNHITDATYGVSYNGSTGKYMDNLTSGVTIPFSGGTSIGVND